METAKISSIAQFITKANFSLTATEIKTDIVAFIVDYLNEIYISEDKIIDTKIKGNDELIFDENLCRTIRRNISKHKRSIEELAKKLFV